MNKSYIDRFLYNYTEGLRYYENKGKMGGIEDFLSDVLISGSNIRWIIKYTLFVSLVYKRMKL